MFTGIIRSVGIVEKIEKKEKGLRLIIKYEPNFSVLLGYSISVNGVCLTLTKYESSLLYFDIMNETIEKTNFSTLVIGDSINLEPALSVGDELGGHFVYGHIDTIGKIIDVLKEDSNYLINIEIDENWSRYIVNQGSITIDGVSLTVCNKSKTKFKVSLVDYTIKHTTLGKLKKDDTVNIEVDMIAKYIESLVKN